MANKYRIEATPEEQESGQVQEPSSGMHTNNGVPREEANVEAEKGETMVTTDGVSNQKKIVAIGGKKHGNGGTPLDVEDGTAIYSDKLKIKDPFILKFFNESGKKEKTFAQLSKKYDITKWQKDLENPDNDNITNDSLEKNLDDGNFKLSALFAIQEFHEDKGAPEEHSKHFEPFMERMGINYDQLFGSVGGGESAPEPLLANDGGEMMFDEIPHMDGGGVAGHKHNPDGSHFAPGSTRYAYEDRFKEAGWEWQNNLRNNLGLAPLHKNAIGNESAMNKGAAEVQKWFGEKDNEQLALDFAFGTSDRPTNKTQKLLRKEGFKPANGVDFTNEEMSELYSSGKIKASLIIDGLQDNLWTERGAYDVITDVDQKTWDAKQKDLSERGIDGPDGLKYLNMGNGKYEAYRYNPDGTIERVEPNPKVVDEVYQWELNKGIDASPRERNMDFRWDHKRALAQAVKNKTRIPRISAFTPIEDTAYAEQIYYNPDQAISSMQSMVSDAGTKQAMFAPQQQQVSNFLAGQQFDLMGKIISQYEDKNVAAHNRESLTNTGIANRASQRLAKAIEGHHDKTSVLQQEFSNARTNADNNIAENEIAMWDERRKRLNLEATIGEQFATDPNTGLHDFQYGKDYGPQNEGTDKTVAMVDRLKKKYPGMDDREIVKVAQLALSGKYEVTEEPYNRDNYNS